VSDIADAQAGQGLTDGERALLDFEAGWWRSGAPKDAQIRAKFDLSTSRYHQAINALIDRPEALAYAPVLVQRLRRLRDQRRVDRSAAKVAPLR